MRNKKMMISTLGTMLAASAMFPLQRIDETARVTGSALKAVTLSDSDIATLAAAEEKRKRKAKSCKLSPSHTSKNIGEK